MVVFGTRPEAIKMCPLVKELETFSLTPAYNLDIMKENQTLFDITNRQRRNSRGVTKSIRKNTIR